MSFGKSVKLPYQLSTSHYSEIFGLMHLDIWGPYKVLTEEKIKNVRSDNALEFVHGGLGEYLAKKGVIHQTSCPDRPQQNGRVERKHRHILDTARALIMYVNLPLRFWEDCVVTATYLINRFPTPVLKNKAPYEVLLQQKPTYDHLMVFGCLVMAGNPTRIADKFKERVVACVFLGYPANQKGYKLYNLKSYSTFMSRDIIFFEHILPFNAQSYNHYITSIPDFDLTNPHTCTPSQNQTHPCVYDTTSDQIPSNTFNTNSQPNTGQIPVEVRRSTRASSTPVWHKEYAMSHVPVANQVSSLSLGPIFASYMAALTATSNPTFFHQAINDPGWCDAMDAELSALEENDTWDINSLP
ncbi:uncharacterized protein [Rutidosis leptorrhynchoides]|uniref:uncharacterized protein n=1 Tax=Rutidosis leptorrhynchoides TaxID=125765 RepID=UPI003A99BC79